MFEETCVRYIKITGLSRVERNIMYKNNFELSVLVKGNATKEYHLNSKTFIESRIGSEYSLRIKNNTGKRALATVAIDNINVINSKSGGDSDVGYILEPYSTINIAGYRIDENNVSKFVFASKDKSYAAQVGPKVLQNGQEVNIPDSSNCGVIGVKITLEKEEKVQAINWLAPSFIDNDSWYPKPLWQPPYNPKPKKPRSPWWGDDFYGTSLKDDTSSFMGNSSIKHCCSNSISSSAPNFDNGTSWGSKVQDKVVEVEFKKSKETFNLVIYYASRKALESYGIDFESKKKVYTNGFPKPFEKSNSKYCTKPLDYKD